MARKLSETIRHAVFLFATAGGMLAAEQATADEKPPVARAPVMVQNPFAARAAQSSTQAKHTAPKRPSVAVYRNPFAAGATAPPIEHPILPGPVSRWHRSATPFEEPSAVKAAILSAASINDLHAPWDQLPPAESLRDRIASRTMAAAPNAGISAEPPDPVTFSATPLAQPVWLAAESKPAQPLSTIDRATFDQPIVGERPGPWASGPAQLARFDVESSPVIVTDVDESPQELLKQAQQAASAAQSMDEMSAVASLCQRGLAAEPSVELSTSLRRLTAWAHNRRGELLADADRPQEAFDAFQLAISLDANCSLAIHNRAVSLAQQNQFAAALDDFNRVIELNPGLAVAYRNRAELLAAVERLEEAVADYGRAIESLPEDAELYAARGNAWQRLGDFDRAGADYDRALEIAPDEPDFITQRGNLNAERGEYGRAVADFQQAVAIDPKCAAAHRSLAWLQATCPDERYRNSEQALSAVRSAVELSAPEDYLVLEALAAAHAAGGEFNEAVRAQRQAVSAAPPEFLEPLRERLALYEARQPFRNSPAGRTSRPSPKQRAR